MRNVHNCSSVRLFIAIFFEIFINNFNCQAEVIINLSSFAYYFTALTTCFNEKEKYKHHYEILMTNIQVNDHLFYLKASNKNHHHINNNNDSHQKCQEVCSIILNPQIINKKRTIIDLFFKCNVKTQDKHDKLTNNNSKIINSIQYKEVNMIFKKYLFYFNCLDKCVPLDFGDMKMGLLNLRHDKNNVDLIKIIRLNKNDKDNSIIYELFQKFFNSSSSSLRVDLSKNKIANVISSSTLASQQHSCVLYRNKNRKCANLTWMEYKNKDMFTKFTMKKNDVTLKECMFLCGKLPSCFTFVFTPYRLCVLKESNGMLEDSQYNISSYKLMCCDGQRKYT